MTQKQIDRLTVPEAVQVLKKNSIKIDFKWKDSDITAKARQILRAEKKLQH